MTKTPSTMLLRLISEAAVFKYVPEDGHRFLAGRVSIEKYKAGEILGAEGTKDGFMWCFMSGRARLLKFSVQGKRIVITYIEPGAWMGYYGTFGDSGSPIDVEAAEASTCAQLSREVMHEAGRRWPGLYRGLFLELLQLTHPLYSLLELSLAQSLHTRVAAVLLRLLKDHQSSKSNGVLLDLPISQAELANMAFCSRQYLNKVLGEWADQGILSMIRRKTIIVHDVRALLAIVRASGTIG